MSKYNVLWEYLQQDNSDCKELSFDEIHNILGFEIDHSFLNFKKELNDYGYTVKKISMKNKTVIFVKTEN